MRDTREFNRSERMAYQIQRELAASIAKEANDPRLRGLTIAEVRINSDLSTATVYITGKDSSAVEDVLAALRSASGFFRKKLASRLQARNVPKLKFTYDYSFDRAAQLQALIDSTMASSKQIE